MPRIQLFSSDSPKERSGKDPHRESQHTTHTQKKTCNEWIDLFSNAGIPCGPIYSIDQMFADEQVNHIGMRHPVKHPSLGNFDVVAQAIRMNRYQPRVGMPTPDRGQHTKEVLNEFGFTDGEVENLYDQEII